MIVSEHSLDESEVNMEHNTDSERVRLAMKGTPRSIITNGDMVEVWVSSPTGDSSDSFIYTIPCLNNAQAETIAETWRYVWGLNKY